LKEVRKLQTRKFSNTSVLCEKTNGKDIKKRRERERDNKPGKKTMTGRSWPGVTEGGVKTLRTRQSSLWTMGQVPGGRVQS
jgi:hypothetical protein